MLPSDVSVSQDGPNCIIFNIATLSIGHSVNIKEQIFKIVEEWLAEREYPRDQVKILPGVFAIRVYSDDPNILMIMRLSF